MRIAMAEAQAAAARGEAPIGAVVADPATGEVLAKAGNAPISSADPTAHAEILALREAAARLGNYRLTGLTLYVTLEPCAMCAGAISHARIGRLVYGAEDPKGGAVTHGPRFFEQPTCHWRPEGEGGLFAEESAMMLRDFFGLVERRSNAPFPLRGKVVRANRGLDGCSKRCHSRRALSCSSVLYISALRAHLLATGRRKLGFERFLERRAQKFVSPS